MRTPSRQKGMTMIGWLIVLALIGFFTLLVLRLGPIYLQNYEVKSHLKGLHQEPLITQKSNAEIRKLLTRRFEIDNIDTVIKPNMIQIDSGEGRIKIRIQYEVRTKILGNVDALVSFDDSTEFVVQ